MKTERIFLICTRCNEDMEPGNVYWTDARPGRNEIWACPDCNLDVILNCVPME